MIGCVSDDPAGVLRLRPLAGAPLVAVALCAAAVTSASAQLLPADRPHLGTYAPFGGFRTANGVRSATVDFYALPQRGPETLFWGARREERRLGSTQVTWADSRSCPGLRGALERLETVPMPALNVPGLGGEPPVQLILDGGSTALWGMASSPDGGESDVVSASAQANSRFDAWIASFSTATQSCWRSEAPDVQP